VESLSTAIKMQLKVQWYRIDETWS
jgi:hypothetical protein